MWPLNNFDRSRGSLPDGLHDKSMARSVWGSGQMPEERLSVVLYCTAVSG